MIYYHGSPVDGLSELKPFLSEHDKPYIYFSTEPLVALLYAVKPVSRSLSAFILTALTKTAVSFIPNTLKTHFMSFITVKRVTCISVRTSKVPKIRPLSTAHMSVPGRSRWIG